MRISSFDVREDGVYLNSDASRKYTAWENRILSDYETLAKYRGKYHWSEG
jgi:hypothetical protein